MKRGMGSPVTLGLPGSVFELAFGVNMHVCFQESMVPFGSIWCQTRLSTTAGPYVRRPKGTASSSRITHSWSCAFWPGFFSYDMSGWWWIASFAIGFSHVGAGAHVEMRARTLGMAASRDVFCFLLGPRSMKRNFGMGGDYHSEVHAGGSVHLSPAGGG